MEGAFDNIFSALRQSEEMALNKRQQSKEVKEAIEKLKVTINFQQSSVQENNAKKDDLEVSLAETTVGLKILLVTEKGLTCDLEAIQKELQHENNRHQELTSNLASLCQENSEKVILFSKEYGLTSLGREKREDLAMGKSNVLKIEADTLKSDVQKLTEQMTTLEASLDFRSQLMMKVNDLEKSIASEEDNLRNQTSNLIALRQRNKELVDEPENGEEYLNNAKLQQQHDIEELQAKAKDYQDELKALTEELKRKDGQVLQSQYRCWQRQRQHHSGVCSEICDEPHESINTSESSHEHVENESSLNKSAEEENESSDFIMISSFEESGKQAIDTQKKTLMCLEQQEMLLL